MNLCPKGHPGHHHSQPLRSKKGSRVIHLRKVSESPKKGNSCLCLSESVHVFWVDIRVQPKVGAQANTTPCACLCQREHVSLSVCLLSI